MGVAPSALFANAPLVVDGGLSTQLTRLGEDISGPLWTGRALLARPDAVRRAHRAFVDAGADVVISASYQVSHAGFVAAGLDANDADVALRASVAVARAATVDAPRDVRVAASVGPYGATLHDGSEYRGRYGRTNAQLAAFHRERLDVLADAEPDLLAVETIPDVQEAEALAGVLADHPDLPAWVSFSAADGARTCAGQPIEEAVAVATAMPSVVAVGVNCTPPRYVEELVGRIRAVTSLPIVIYPNAGGRWDAADGQWHGTEVHDDEPAFADEVLRRWVGAGATLVGGCCGTDATTVAAVARALRAAA